MPIAADGQRLDVGAIVSLYTIERTDGTVFRFVPGADEGAVVRYQGNDFFPMPIVMSGLTADGAGPAPRPTMKISGVDAITISTLLGFENLRGARVTRLRTLERWLDDKPTADPLRHWPVDVFRVESLSGRTKTEMAWVLASPLDYDRKKLPGRQVLRDICSWHYRVWNADTESWNYTHATCPYTGNAFFNADDVVVNNAAQDVCSRRLSGCRLRFGNAPIPFGGFAGVGRLAV